MSFCVRRAFVIAWFVSVEMRCSTRFERVNEYVTEASTLESSNAPTTKMSRIRLRKPILRGRNRFTDLRISLRVRVRRYRESGLSENMSVTIAGDSQVHEPLPRVWGWQDQSPPSCAVVECVRRLGDRRQSIHTPTLCRATIHD